MGRAHSLESLAEECACFFGAFPFPVFTTLSAEKLQCIFGLALSGIKEGETVSFAAEARRNDIGRFTLTKGPNGIIFFQRYVLPRRYKPKRRRKS